MFNPNQCDHKSPRKLVYYDTVNATLYAFECQKCFNLLSKRVGVKRVSELSDHPLFIVDAVPRSEEKNQKLWDEYREDFAIKQADRMASIAEMNKPSTHTDKEEYQNYLQSSEWASTRQRILTRAKGVCEGCLTSPATQVHHMTYDNIYDELAFQLVALCRGCHEKVHHIKPEDEW